MSFKDLLILWAVLLLGARLQSTEAFEGGFSSWRCFHTADTKPLRDCLAFGMKFIVQKNESFLGYIEHQFTLWVFSLDKWDLNLSAITLQTQYLHGFRWTLIKFKDIFAVVHTMYYACLYIIVFIYFLTFDSVPARRNRSRTDFASLR